MKNKNKLLKNVAILIVPALMLTFGCLSASAQGRKICGSLEKFNETKRWEDLSMGTDPDYGSGIEYCNQRNSLAFELSAWTRFSHTWLRRLDTIKSYPRQRSNHTGQPPDQASR